MAKRSLMWNSCDGSEEDIDSNVNSDKSIWLTPSGLFVELEKRPSYWHHGKDLNYAVAFYEWLILKTMNWFTWQTLIFFSIFSFLLVLW